MQCVIDCTNPASQSLLNLPQFKPFLVDKTLGITYVITTGVYLAMISHHGHCRYLLTRYDITDMYKILHKITILSILLSLWSKMNIHPVT